jgi:sulfite exporter TauE/SafE
MNVEVLLTALLVGFLGGVHCLGMCGPIAGALTFQVSAEIQVRPKRLAIMQLGYNLGRVSTYGILGLVAGFVGWALVEAGDWLFIQRWLLAFAGLWMIILAAWFKGWSSLPSKLEGVFSHRWRALSARWRPRMLPVSNVWQAYIFGLLWGLLPCGLVYSTLILAISVGSVWMGGMVMLAFGLGTLPNVLVMGMSAFWLTRFQRQAWVRTVAALAMATFGVLTLWQALWGSAWQGLVS